MLFDFDIHLSYEGSSTFRGLLLSVDMKAMYSFNKMDLK